MNRLGAEQEGGGLSSSCLHCTQKEKNPQIFLWVKGTGEALTIQFDYIAQTMFKNTQSLSFLLKLPLCL